MLKKIYIAALGMLLFGNCHAQIWYDDAGGNGVPLLLDSREGKTLLNGRINTADNSLLISVYNRFKDKNRNKLTKADTMLVRPSGVRRVVTPSKSDTLEILGVPTPSQTDTLEIRRIGILGKPDTLIVRRLATSSNSKPDNTQVRPSNPDRPNPDEFPRDDLQWGWGLSAKGKTESGLGSLLAQGKITPSTTFGGYIIQSGWSEVKKPDSSGHINSKLSVFILGAKYTRSQYRFYYPNEIDISKQISEFQPFNGAEVFVGYYLWKPPHNNSQTNTILGITLSGKGENNYNQLDKVEIKDIQTTTPINTTSPVQTKSVTNVDDDGYTYAKNTKNDPYKENWTWSVRTHFGRVFRGGRAALVCYPSATFSTLGGTSGKINLGIGLHFLKKEQPTLSDAGVIFEFTDLFNANGSAKTLLQRGFKIGLVLGLNVVNNQKP